jgi:peptidoglycan/LPS O-acetylase OafA/YrhL
MTPPTRPETCYRPDIDGLRAVSILLVVACHAHPWLVPGGFVGVDVFFVISGFLITQIILGQIGAGRFSIANFYARRVRRIFPALIVVLSMTCILGWLLLLPDQFLLLGENVAAGVAFAANLLQLRLSGYFAPDASENPLLHLWSLGVEEQFYIVWPPILLLVAGAAGRRFWIAALAAASFCVSLGVVYGYRDWAFYSPLARGWELLAGGLLAEIQLAGKRGRDGKGEMLAAPWANLLSACGLVAIAVSAFALDGKSPFPGPAALPSVAGAVLLLASPNAVVNRYLLSSRPMVFIGLISYPLYLWHWPLLSYLMILRNGVPNFLEIWAAVALALVLSALTFRFVEIPLRHRDGVVPSLSFGLAAIGMAGIAAILASGFEFRFPPEVRQLARISPRDNSGFADRCFLNAHGGGAFDASCIEPGDRPLLFVWGDSSAAALYPGLKHIQQKTGAFRLARYASPGCAPLLDAGTNVHCDEANRIAFRFLVSARPDVVLLHAMWGGYGNLGKLGDTIRQLRANTDARIVLLGPVPVWKRTLPHELINHYRLLHEIPDRLAVGVSGPQEDQRMEALSRAEGIAYISARRELCDSRGCLTRLGASAADVVAIDMVHLSDNGAKYLISAIGKDLPLAASQSAGGSLKQGDAGPEGGHEGKGG